VEFRHRGRPLFVFLNHFNSKRGDEPLFGRRQPPYRDSEARRAEQASVLAEFVQALFAVDPGARIVALGDFNDFEFAQSLRSLNEAGLRNLTESLPLMERYTYIHEGNAQALDHIYVSDALRAHSEYDIVHVNAEFPAEMRASDHDPVLLRLKP
ncbi:MAG TPA: endonuclease/exonuclease/phosphatase family protein, partial [Burkholderiales bacterium]|nr:endonuclease/exonuclease/phosphatase family protein [Burkholderiales bacterium]